MSANFYQYCLVCVAVWWTLITVANERPLFKVTESSVVTIPTWLPKQIILWLQDSRPLVFYGENIGIALASCFPGQYYIRLLAAWLYTLYHLTESSQTNRHGEYPILQSMWAMCLSDSRLRHACIWGIVINFCLSTGYAKLNVGGLYDDTIFPLWIHPSTMETYLNCYRQSSNQMSRPLLPTFNKFFSNFSIFTATMSMLILFVECILVPATLFMPPDLRPIGCYAMIIMHIGIAFFMSFQVGLVFITSIPAYLYGFHCNVPFGSVYWLVSVLIGLGPTFWSYLVGCSVLAEDWPCTPAALFMWDGTTARSLVHLLMTGDTRIVFATDYVSTKNLIGLRVLHHTESYESVIGKNNEHVVHDCVMRSIGFTLIQGGEPLVEAVLELAQDPDPFGKAAAKLLHRTWGWLNVEERLVEAHTGGKLTHAYLVRVDDSKRITEILL